MGWHVVFDGTCLGAGDMFRLVLCKPWPMRLKFVGVELEISMGETLAVQTDLARWRRRGSYS